MKIGDRVRLVSGGPLMTVAGRSKRGWRCLWFATMSGDPSQHSAVFPEAALKVEQPVKAVK